MRVPDSDCEKASMISCEFCSSANGGFSLGIGGRRFVIDALHDGQRDTYASLDPRQYVTLSRNIAFSDPTAICFTHCHRDHFSRRLTEEYCGLYPAAELLLPEPFFPTQVVMTQCHEEFSWGDVTLHAFRTVHAGKEYKNVPHYSFIVSFSGKRVFVAGDADVSDQTLLAAQLSGGCVDVAVLPFPWATLTRGRSLVTGSLRPKKLILNHLPKNDDYGYLTALYRQMPLPDPIDTYCISEPFQFLSLYI